ncbi:MAG: RnfABCDGE type electron transport complex subunit B [Verrucomicrobia bacterium]|nr:RnfABCDGE type electron transport complex subunit B [Verrucomicrobiota bacterium]
MDPMIMVMAGGSMLLLSVGAGYVLGWANRTFHVEVDPRVEAVNGALPGANCGGCGYVGCASYAEAVVLQGEAVDKCPVGGASCAAKLAGILGVDVKQSWPKRPVVHCRATLEQRLQRTAYTGERSCSAANILSGVQGCTYGCLGLGDCVRACTFDAIHIVDGLATVDYEKCTGCSACARVCPRNIITMVPFKQERMLVVGCSNKDFGREVKDVCTTGCIGCKACAKRSPLFAFGVDNLPVINYDEYDPSNMEATELAIEKCPMKGLVYVGKPPKAGAVDGEVPDLVTADFKTTVDDTDWQG